MKLVECKNLQKTYGSGETAVRALGGVDLCIERGEFTAIVGASGSGKSTLLHILASVDRPTAGSAQVDGVDVGSLTPAKAALFRRRKVGLVYQFFNLDPNVDGGEKHRPAAAAGQTQARRRMVRHAGQHTGLAGQTAGAAGPAFRRAAAAGGHCPRAVLPARLLLADEPTGNLDRRNAAEIWDLLQLCHRNFQQTILLVTHDEHLAAQAGRVVTLSDGRVVRDSAQDTQRG